jgi:hypothetical protein
MDGTHHGLLLEASPAFKIRKMLQNLSQSSEGTEEIISGLNSSSTCYMTQVRVRGGMKRQLFYVTHHFHILTGPKGKAICLKSTRDYKKACALRQSARNGVVL